MWRIRSFFRGIGNLLYYFPVVWRDRDWDYDYIISILQVKLKKTYKRYKDNEFFVDQDKNLNKPLKICVEILRRDEEGFYYNVDNSLYWIESVNSLLGDECITRNRKLLFNIMSKYIECWWD